jgi:hypothetical protein
MWAIVLASLARFGSWLTPRWLGGPAKQRHLEVKRTVEELKARGAETPPLELRSLTVEHWRTRATSTRELGNHKQRWLMQALLGLGIPATLLFAIGVLLVVSGSPD